MNYYNIQYFRGTKASGAMYTVRSEKEYKSGDVVRLYGGKRALVICEGDMDYVKRVGDEGIISIVGKVEEEKDDN